MHNVGRGTRQLLIFILTCKGWAGYSQEEKRTPFLLPLDLIVQLPPTSAAPSGNTEVRFTRVFTCANAGSHAPGYKVQSVDIIETLQNNAQHQEQPLFSLTSPRSGSRGVQSCKLAPVLLQSTSVVH